MNHARLQRALVLLAVPMMVALVSWPVAFVSMRKTYSAGSQLLTSQKAVEKDTQNRAKGIARRLRAIEADEAELFSFELSVHKEVKEETNPPKKKKPKKAVQTTPHSIIVATSLKSCTDSTKICDAQWNAIRSWTLNRDVEVHIFASEDDTFDVSNIDPTQLTIHRNGVEEGSESEDIFVVSKGSKIPLLSSMMAILALRADSLIASGTPFVSIMFINGDIILPPHQLGQSVDVLRKKFTKFFAVGHRKTIEVEGKILSANWGESTLVSAEGGYRGKLEGPGATDRTDAEDFFLFSHDFFVDLQKFPAFRIGRPAYDNWLVHKAITSGGPVVDISHMLTAIHQKHDYSHLKKKDGKDSYWKTTDQERNYALGKANGGWRFGLIEFSPFVAKPPFCADGNINSIQNECEIDFNINWKPPQGTSLSKPGYENFFVENAKQKMRSTVKPYTEDGESESDETEETPAPTKKKRKRKKKKKTHRHDEE